MSDHKMTAAWVLVDLCNSSNISGSDLENISGWLLVEVVSNESIHSDEILSTDVSYSDISLHDLIPIDEISRDSGHYNHELRVAIDSHEKIIPTNDILCFHLYKLKRQSTGWLMNIRSVLFIVFGSQW